MTSFTKMDQSPRSEDRRACLRVLLALAMTAAGCAPDPGSAVRMVHEINDIFQKEYEAILAQLGVTDMNPPWL